MADGQARETKIEPSLLQPGRTCWKLERADRLSVIVDGAEYFRHLRTALRSAKRAAYLIGWDLDLRLEMVPGESDEAGNAPDGLPNRLGEFLRRIVHDTPDLSLYILKWDKAMLVQLSQQLPETVGLTLASERIHFALDSHHPTGATHHQKIVVVDDAFAFCGGIDVTNGRWDTRAHEPDDPRRRGPGLGAAIEKPWHDVTTALSGPAAKALGKLARKRWRAANGEDLGPPGSFTASWPEDLAVDLCEIDVAIARTVPDYHDQDAVDEIEQLYLSAICAAKETIYLESQYFASGAICRALEDRLSDPGGPELVVINPDRAEGLVQHQVMDTGRARMIERVRAAAEAGGGGNDGRKRFRIYHPANAADEPIYIHAKVLIVDDRLVRIGSSNVNNRSMGFDTECDVAFETTDAEQRAFARRLRHDLLAEHLGATVDAVAEAMDHHGSVIAAIESLNGRADRRLHAIDEVPQNALEREAGERLLFDERAWTRNQVYPVRSVTHGMKRMAAPYQLQTVGAGLVLLGLAAFGLAIWAGVRAGKRRADRHPPPFPMPAVETRGSPRRMVAVAVDPPVNGPPAVVAVRTEGR